MPSISWGRFSGNNRGSKGHVVKGRKCEKTEGNVDAVKCKEGEGIKKRGAILRNRCVKCPVVDALIEIKIKPNQEEGIVKTIDSCERNVDTKSRVVTAASGKIKSRRSVQNSACTEQGIWHSVCADKEKHVTRTRNGKGMMHVELNAFPVEKKKRADSSYKGQNAVDISNMKDVVYDKAEDAACMKSVECDKAGDAVCPRNTVTDSPTQTKTDLSSTSIRHKVCSAGIEEETGFHEKNVDSGAGFRESATVPHDFVCGISKKVMEDPVVVASGQTFERVCIQAWLDDGNTLCPITHKPLSHPQLIPNLTLKTLISSWLSSQSQDVHPETVHHSFSSCMSSFSSCPSLMTPHHQSFVSCSSFSVSKLIGDTELYSSSSSSPSLPKLCLGAEPHSFSSSSISALSYGTPEHLRGGGIHNFPSTPSSTTSSTCWEQEAEACSLEEKEVLDTSQQLVGSTQEKQGGDGKVMSKTHSAKSKTLQGYNLDSKSNDPIPQSTEPGTYIASRIKSLVSDLDSEYIDIQRNAAAELRLLAKHVDNNRLMIANAGALRPLVALLLSKDTSIQLDATTTLLNLSLNHTLKEGILKEGAIEALVRVLRDGLCIGTKENAAIALASLAVGDTNKSKIGEAGAVVPLVYLLDRGSPRGKKDAAAALYRLSSIDENKRRMVRAGASKLLVDFISAEGEKDIVVDNAMSGEGEKDVVVYKAMSSKGGKDVMVDNAMSGKHEKDVMVDKTIAKDCTMDKDIAILGNFVSSKGGRVEDKAIAKDGMVDKAIAILGNLVSIEEGRVAFVEEGGIMSLMKVIQEGSKRSKKLAVPILLQLCTHSSKHRSLVLQKEPLPTLMALSKTGNLRLKTQVAEVIQILIVDAYA